MLFLHFLFLWFIIIFCGLSYQINNNKWIEVEHDIPFLRISKEKLWTSSCFWPRLAGCLYWGKPLLNTRLMRRPWRGLWAMLSSRGSLGTSRSTALMTEESSSFLWPSHTWWKQVRKVSCVQWTSVWKRHAFFWQIAQNK